MTLKQRHKISLVVIWSYLHFTVTDPTQLLSRRDDLPYYVLRFHELILQPYRMLLKAWQTRRSGEQSSSRLDRYLKPSLFTSPTQPRPMTNPIGPRLTPLAGNKDGDTYLILIPCTQTQFLVSNLLSSPCMTIATYLVRQEDIFAFTLSASCPVKDSSVGAWRTRMRGLFSFPLLSVFLAYAMSPFLPKENLELDIWRGWVVKALYLYLLILFQICWYLTMSN